MGLFDFKTRIQNYLGIETRKQSQSPTLKKNININLYQALSLLINQIDPHEMSDGELLGAVRGIVFACLDIISDDIAQTDFRIVRTLRDGTYEEIPDHPIMLLLNDPFRRADGFSNFALTRFDLFKLTSMQLMTLGRSYWKLNFDSGIYGGQPVGNRYAGRPAQIFPLDPCFINPHLDPQKVVDYYEYNTAGKVLKFPANEVIHFRNISPDMTKFFRGLSIVGMCKWEIKELEAMQTAIYNAFMKGGLPQAFLVGKDLSEEDAQRTGDVLRAEFIHNSPDKKALPILTGDWELLTMNLSNKDLDTILLLKEMRDMIMAIFRVPPSKLGLRESVSQADAMEQDRTFKRDVKQPKVIAMEQMLNLDFVSLWREPDIKIEFINIVPFDVDRMARNASALFIANIINRGEAREMVELQPYGDVRDETFSSELRPTFNLADLTGGGQSNQNREPQKKIKAIKLPISIKESLPGLFKNNGQDDRRVWRALMARQTKKYNPEYMGFLNDYFKGLDKRIQENLSRLKSFKEKNGLVKLQSGDAESVLPHFETERHKLYDASNPTVLNYYKNSANRTAELFAKLTGGDMILFNEADPRVVQYFMEGNRNGAFKFTWEIQDTAFKDLRELFAQAAIEGKNPAQIAPMIEELLADYETAQGYKALRIAETELITGFNRSNHDMSLQINDNIGGILKKHWYSAFLPTSRDSHMQNDDYSRERGGIPEDETFPFAEGSVKMEFAGDPNADAADRCNCHCTGGDTIELAEGDSI